MLLFDAISPVKQNSATARKGIIKSTPKGFKYDQLAPFSVSTRRSIFPSRCDPLYKFQEKGRNDQSLNKPIQVLFEMFQCSVRVKYCADTVKFDSHSICFLRLVKTDLFFSANNFKS